MGLKILYNNINGFLSKKESLNKIVKDLQPDIVALCETKKCGKTGKDDLIGYEILECDMKRGKEGLLIAVKENSFTSIRDVGEIKNELKNIMAVRIEFPLVVLRVIIVHAPQETEKPDVREEFMEELLVQIERGRTSGEETLVLGDLNGRLEKCDKSIVGSQTSPNGKAISEIVEDYQLEVGNFHPSTTGRWTRIQPKKNGNVSKSAIDYALMGRKLYNSMSEMHIDEEKISTPYHETSRKGMKHIVFSDHCSIILDFHLDVGVVQKSNVSRNRW